MRPPEQAVTVNRPERLTAPGLIKSKCCCCYIADRSPDSAPNKSTVGDVERLPATKAQSDLRCDNMRYRAYAEM